MSTPVEPVRSMSSLPLWIIAVAISAVAIRYTFFPPCCDKYAQPVTHAYALCDSIRPVPDGSGLCYGDGDTAYLSSTGRMVLRGKRLDTITIPAGGSVTFRRP